MLNEDKLKILYATNPEKVAYNVLRKYGKDKDQYFNVFKAINDLDMRVALADYGVDEDGEVLECCQFVPRNSSEKGYIILSNNLSVERIRFNSAIMLYCAIRNQSNIVTYKPGVNNKMLHQAKVFAVNLLIPEKELKTFVYNVDKNGKYLYLDEKGEISLDNINYVAQHFGAPFKTTATRILNVIGNIKGIKTKEKLLKEIKNRNYLRPMDIKSSRYKKEMCEQLIDSLRYLQVEKTRSLTLEKILRECVKNESLLEGVVKDTKGVDFLLHLFAHGGEIDDMCRLHNKNNDKVIQLTENQLIILGNYELLKEIAYEGAAYYTSDNKKVVEESINKAGYGMSSGEIKESLMDIGVKYLEGLFTYKEAENILKNELSMKQYEIDNFMVNLLGFDHYTINRFHKTLFKHSREQEHIKGKYRNTKVIVPGASFDTAEVSEIYSKMESLNYDIIDLLKEKDELTNSEYIHKVNVIIARFIMIHPFEDGNGRVSRALTNFLYKKKNLPFVFIDANNQRSNYIEALKEIDFSELDNYCKDVDCTNFDIVMYNSIATSYSNIYQGSKMLNNPEKEISRNRLAKSRK